MRSAATKMKEAGEFNSREILLEFWLICQTSLRHFCAILQRIYHLLSSSEQNHVSASPRKSGSRAPRTALGKDC
jgi:hypothetical protein